MNIGITLKNLRKINNLTIKDLANILGIAKITYNHYETQEKIIPLERLNDIANYYNISIDYILNFTDNKQYLNSKKEFNIKLSSTRLKEFRKENSLTQVKLASFLNTVHPTITNYENGKHLIALPFLYTICKRYNMSADYLLGKIDEPKYFK